MKKKEFLPVTIRPCTEADIPDLDYISSQIWDGSDYLARVAMDWIRDGGFYGAELEGRVVGCFKLTIFPDQVAWMEGLRVLPEYQGHGIARQLNGSLMQLVLKLRAEGVIKQIEFCTYYKNKESISLAQKAGFRIVSRFFLLSRSVTRRKAEPMELCHQLPDLRSWGTYLPCGWKSVHNSEEGRSWLQQHVKTYCLNEITFYVGGVEKVAVIPDLDEDKLLILMPALNFLFQEQGEIQILIPERNQDHIPMLKRHRFYFWHRPVEPNMLIFRLLDS